MATFEFFNKGAEIRRTTSAMRNCTVEKRRNLNRSSIGLIECLDCPVSFIQSSTTFTATANSPGHSDGNSAYRCF